MRHQVTNHESDTVDAAPDVADKVSQFHEQPADDDEELEDAVAEQRNDLLLDEDELVESVRRGDEATCQRILIRLGQLVVPVVLLLGPNIGYVYLVTDQDVPSQLKSLGTFAITIVKV